MRNTRQRTAIRDVLEKADRPLSPQEILEEAQHYHSNTGIATVYRHIHTLAEMGVLIPVEIPGEQTRYELAGKEHHHHFHCRDCGRVFEVFGCPDNLSSIKPKGFQVDRHEIILYGLCKECKKHHG